MKVSDITVDTLVEYLREDDISNEDRIMLPSILEAAKSYISNYTGIPRESESEKTIDSYPEFWVVCLVISQDMYETRTMNIAANKMGKNRVVESILNMHRRNLL